MAKVKKKRGKSVNKSINNFSSRYQKNIFKSYTFWILITLLAIFLVFLIINNAQEPRLAPNVPEQPVSGTQSGQDFVSFFTSIVTNTIDLATNAGKPLFISLLGDVPTGGDLFVKVLIFLLVVLVTVAVLESIPFFSQRYWLQVSIAAIISIIGIRFLPPGMIEAMAFPSTVFVASISIGFPFLLYGIVLHRGVQNHYLRRVGWVIFGVIVFVLWFYNSNKEFFYIYPLFLLGGLIAFWFDGTLQNFMGRAKIQRDIERATTVQEKRIIAEIRDLQGSLANEPPLEAAKTIKLIDEKKQALKKLRKLGP